MTDTKEEEDVDFSDQPPVEIADPPPVWKREKFTKADRPRHSNARQGFPEPILVIPHSGNLNRAQRRSQGRRGAFLTKASHGARVAPMLIKRSGVGSWSKKDREKLERYLARTSMDEVRSQAEMNDLLDSRKES